jgi:hypothetical protein
MGKDDGRASHDARAPGGIERSGKWIFLLLVVTRPSRIGVAADSVPAGPFADSGALLLDDDGKKDSRPLSR